LEATTGWRFVVEELQRIGAVVHLAGGHRGVEGQQEARTTAPTLGICWSC
jgi:hypothetical protein